MQSASGNSAVAWAAYLQTARVTLRMDRQQYWAKRPSFQGFPVPLQGCNCHCRTLHAGHHYDSETGFAGYGGGADDDA